jgi:hypothetical protein
LNKNSQTVGKSGKASGAKDQTPDSSHWRPHLFPSTEIRSASVFALPSVVIYFSHAPRRSRLTPLHRGLLKAKPSTLPKEENSLGRR